MLIQTVRWLDDISPGILLPSHLSTRRPHLFHICEKAETAMKVTTLPLPDG